MFKYLLLIIFASSTSLAGSSLTVEKVIHFANILKNKKQFLKQLKKEAPKVFTTEKALLVYDSSSPCHGEVNGVFPRTILVDEEFGKQSIQIAYTGSQSGFCKDRVEVLDCSVKSKKCKTHIIVGPEKPMIFLIL